jgi:hypothetical protein
VRRDRSASEGDRVCVSTLRSISARSDVRTGPPIPVAVTLQFYSRPRGCRRRLRSFVLSETVFSPSKSRRRQYSVRTSASGDLTAIYPINASRIGESSENSSRPILIPHDCYW